MNPEIKYLRTKAWKLRNPEKVRAQKKRYRVNHRERHLAKQREYSRTWRERHPEKWKLSYTQANHKQYATVSGRLNSAMKTGIQKSLHGDKAGRRWETLVGYTLSELREHLESRFTEGMTWEKVRVGEIHVDHIFPLARLVITGPEDPTFRYAWSLGNLQPLWASDNWKKNDKVPWQL
jgi:hypothetical protein